MIWSQQNTADVIMSAIASQITGVSIVYSTVCSDADRRKHQSSTSPAFVKEIHRWPVNFPHKGPVTRKVFPFDDVIMICTDDWIIRSAIKVQRIFVILQLWAYKSTVKWIPCFYHFSTENIPIVCGESIYEHRFHLDDAMFWKHFRHYWPFVRGICRLRVDSTHNRPVIRNLLQIDAIICWTNSRYTWFWGELTLMWRHYNTKLTEQRMIKAWN